MENLEIHPESRVSVQGKFAGVDCLSCAWPMRYTKAGRPQPKNREEKLETAVRGLSLSCAAVSAATTASRF